MLRPAAFVSYSQKAPIEAVYRMMRQVIFVHPHQLMHCLCFMQLMRDFFLRVGGNEGFFLENGTPFRAAKFILHRIPTISDPFLLQSSDCLLVRSHTNNDLFVSDEGLHVRPFLCR